MRNCGMCGTIIPQGVYECPNCGGIVTEDFDVDQIIGAPDWGKINIDLDSFEGDVADLYRRIKEFWRKMEMGTAQRLFSGQLDEVVSPVSNLVLYGPLESFLRLKRELVAAGASQSIIKYDSMRYDEIDVAQARFEKGWKN